MATTPSLSDLYVVIELIVPGFWTFWLIRHAGQWEVQPTDSQTVYASLILSLIDSVLLSLVTGISSLDQLTTQAISASVILPLLFFATLVGVVVGLTSRWKWLTNSRIVVEVFGVRAYAGTAWKKFVDEYWGKKVHLKTVDGREYLGYLTWATVGSDEPREVYLSGYFPKEVHEGNVQQIERNNDGKILAKKDVGPSIFFPSNTIASIWRDLDG